MLIHVSKRDPGNNTRKMFSWTLSFPVLFPCPSGLLHWYWGNHEEYGKNQSQSSAKDWIQSVYRQVYSSTFVQVMAWFRQATSHYLSQIIYKMIHTYISYITHLQVCVQLGLLRPLLEHRQSRGQRIRQFCYFGCNWISRLSLLSPDLGPLGPAVDFVWHAASRGCLVVSDYGGTRYWWIQCKMPSYL